MSDLVSVGDFVDFKGQKYILQMKGDHKEHVIVREGELKVVSAEELKRWQEPDI